MNICCRTIGTELTLTHPICKVVDKVNDTFSADDRKKSAHNVGTPLNLHSNGLAPKRRSSHAHALELNLF